MTTANKIEAFRKLYELINFYYEERDQPVPEGYDFHAEVRQYCEVLELNAEEFILEFKLYFEAN